ncbi:MAG: alpha/beta hydrolase-fold protein [Bacteroidota bacterium]
MYTFACMNRTLLFTVLVTIFAGGNLVAQKGLPALDKAALTIGETLTFASEILGEERRLNVYLPASYADSTASEYPVIYLLDGSYTEDLLHILGLVQFGSYPWIDWIPESIVVGIENVDRRRDFTFVSNWKKALKEIPTAGESANFIQFIEEEVQPLVEQQYRTTDTRTLIGQSLGGLLASEILLKKPQLFSHYVIVSPSLWWDKESLLDYEPNFQDWQGKVFIGVGTEGKVMERTAKELHVLLGEKGLPNEHLFFQFIPELNHATALHLSFYRAMEVMSWR